LGTNTRIPSVGVSPVSTPHSAQTGFGQEPILEFLRMSPVCFDPILWTDMF